MASVVDEILRHRPQGWKWSCAGLTLEDVDKASDVEKEAVELVLVQFMRVYDEDGVYRPFPPCPALALAIVREMKRLL